MADEIKYEYVCPLTRDTCLSSCDSVKENPFTGTQTVQQCAWGTSDGRCSVALLMQAVYTSTNRRDY